MSVDKPQILIVGASGLVGGYLLEYFGDRAAGTGNANTGKRAGLVACDITDPCQTMQVIANSGASVVIHTAAYTHVDGCEQDPDRSRAVNVEGTRNVAEACAETGIRYVFVSTDYIFDGESGPHKIGEDVAPLNVYGQHKLDAERIVSATLDDHAIVRACNIYGWQPGGKNFVMAVHELGTTGKPMRVPVDQFGNPTLAADMAAAMERLALGKERGVFHFAGPDYVDRLEWAQRSARAFGIDPGFVSGVSTSELGQPAVRPLKGGLDASETCAQLGVRFSTLDEGLASMRAAMESDGVRFETAAG